MWKIVLPPCHRKTCTRTNPAVGRNGGSIHKNWVNKKCSPGYNLQVLFWSLTPEMTFSWSNRRCASGIFFTGVENPQNGGICWKNPRTALCAPIRLASGFERKRLSSDLFHQITHSDFFLQMIKNLRWFSTLTTTTYINYHSRQGFHLFHKLYNFLELRDEKYVLL